MSILERSPREPGARRLRLGLLLLPLLLGGLVLAVREVAHVEKALAAEGERVQRVVVYEIAIDGELHAQIGPGTDVVRLVFHALRRQGPLDPQRHAAHVRIRARGLRGELQEDVTLALPGTTARVAPEDGALALGDPLSINLDLHGVGAGELLVSLIGLEGADAVAVRMYRRDVISGDALTERLEGMDDVARMHVALHVGEIAFVDAEPDEQRVLLAERWHKLPATRGTGAPLRTLAVALTRASDTSEADALNDLAELPAAPVPDDVVELLGFERASWLVHGPCSLRLAAVDDPKAELRAQVRDAEGAVRTLVGAGELSFAVEEGRLASVEAMRAGPGRLALHAQGDGAVEPAAHAIAWRTTPARPLFVDAGTSDLVLRVSARRPLARASLGDFEIALDASIESGGDAPAQRASTTLRATRPRAPFDRYEGPSPLEAPTESAVFHVLVPAGARVRLAPREGEIDLALAELDPEAPPRPTPTFPVERGWKPTVESGGTTAPGYAPRRPTNADALPADARIVVHLPRRLVELPTPPLAAPSWRVDRPASATTLTLAGRIFEPETATYEIEIPGTREPLVLPVRLYATTSMSLVARIDGGEPRRLTVGFADAVTTARAFSVDGEVRGVVVLGDDLAPGPHTLRFETAPGEHAWIHLPWAAKPRAPGSPPRPPHWIEGDLDD
jgi:hypothetical protein